jgi:hypothetical protein
VNPPGFAKLFSPAVAINALLLVFMLGAGIAVIVAVRRRLGLSSRHASEHASGRGFGPASVHGEAGHSGLAGGAGWENTIAEYKNLRDEGVLSEEEFRKIRTLVEPPAARHARTPPAAPAADGSRTASDHQGMN